MRGIKRNEKEKVMEMLRNRVPVCVISKQINVPPTTLSTWYNEYKKEFYQNDKPIINIEEFKKEIEFSESVITSVISPYINEEITDGEWFKITGKISDELYCLCQKIIDYKTTA